jgi:hypothetical protein
LNYYFSAIKLGSLRPVMTVVQKDRAPQHRLDQFRSVVNIEYVGMVGITSVERETSG